ncbi:MAG: hypothetical protein Q9175_000035 [Cornicularia normoerica]
MESTRARLLPMLELLLPTAAILYLLWNGDREFTESFYRYLKTDQATIQIVVQVVSHVLAMLQVSCLCATLNLSTRFRFLRRSASLHDLKFWTALSTTQVDLSLPSFYLAVAAAFVVATFVPGALWAGALSPLFVLKTRELGGQILPAFSDKTRANWDSQFQVRGSRIWNINDKCTLINDARGLVPSCPVPTLQGLLLLSASSVTTLDGWPRKHSKLDNPSWEYIGRSFGIGSSVGQTNDNITDDRVLYYNYTEIGYVANVSCIQNSTSDFYFRLIGYTERNISASEYQNTHHPELEFNHSLPPTRSQLSTYFAEGYLPNSVMGVPELYPVISWHKEYENITAWAASANDGRNLIAVAAGTNLYQKLNQTQCEAFFTPTAFNVTVNRSQQSIAVKAQVPAEPQQIEPTGHLVANVMHSINLLARMSPSLYVSVLGETLSRNVERMQKQNPPLNLTEAVTSAVADSFTAIIDDILVAYGASQIINAHDTTSGAARGVVEAVQIGQPLYRHLVFALNSLLILVVVSQAAHTRFWHRLTKFNYLDFISVGIAFSAGGSDIAKAVLDEHQKKGTDWVADPSDPIACAMRVKWNLNTMLGDTETMAIVKSEDSGVVRRRRVHKERSRNSVKLARLDSNSSALLGSNLD